MFGTWHPLHRHLFHKKLPVDVISLVVTNDELIELITSLNIATLTRHYSQNEFSKPDEIPWIIVIPARFLIPLKVVLARETGIQRIHAVETYHLPQK